MMPIWPGAPLGELPASRRARWGVILAGGDGTRLQPLTRLICGDHRPKQFCALVGHDTLLEQTRKRAEQSIPWQQIVFTLTRSHQPFYLHESAILPSQRIVQPSSRGTAPPLLFSLLSIEKQDRQAMVAVLPSDHYYADERRFTEVLESAFAIAAKRTGSVVLLAAPPHGPEVEYGWIELGPSTGDAGGAVFHVRGFREKPAPTVARQLWERGSLWNTFVMVGHVGAFLDMMKATFPAVVDLFRNTRLWDGAEIQIGQELYDRVDAIDFSRQVLTPQRDRLIALPMNRTGWNDLGDPARVMDVLDAAGLEPWWSTRWHASKPAMSAGRGLKKTAVA